MRKITLFIAMSLDGYIADPQGGVDWLSGQGGEGEKDFYGEFIRGVDTVVMGGNTYRQIIEKLSPGRWPYEGLTAYVLTHRPQPAAEGVVFTDGPACRLAAELKSRPGKGIWVCGGAAVAQALIAGGLIDEYRISIIPTILGGGIPLFGRLPAEIKLSLVGARTSDGMAELTYRPRGAGSRAGEPRD